jgi:hypothetical protein
MRGTRNAYKIFIGEFQNKISVGKPGHRCKSHTEMYLRELISAGS